MTNLDSDVFKLSGTRRYLTSASLETDKFVRHSVHCISNVSCFHFPTKCPNPMSCTADRYEGALHLEILNKFINHCFLMYFKEEDVLRFTFVTGLDGQSRVRPEAMKFSFSRKNLAC